METIRRSPDPVGAVLSWAFGLGLIVLGASWLFIDQSMVVLDLVCIGVGFAALPPITEALRLFKPFSGRAHALAGFGVLAFGFLFTVYGPNPSATLQHRFASNVGAFAAIAEAEAAQAADARALKATYLADVAAASGSAQKLDASSFVADRDAVFAGLRTLEGWRALAVRAEEYALTAEEQAQVAAFGALVQKQRAMMTPALRRAYADSLRNALSSYGVTAEAEGAGAESLHVVGYALNDQTVLAKVRTLLSRDTQALGYAQVDFVAERTSASASAAVAAGAVAETPKPADAAATVISAVAPNVVAASTSASDAAPVARGPTL
jgi:hypothetical protein